MASIHKQGNILIGLSILPGLPFLIYGSFGAIAGMGHMSASWGWMAAPIILGIAGSAGLVLASVPAGSKVLVTSLIACGYLALVVAILGMYLSFREQQTLLPPHVMGQPFPIARLIMLLLMLAWPICAGVVALIGTWRDQS